MNTVPTKPSPGATPIQYGDADEPKEGSLCCGCCCDFRRAVIITNIFGAILMGLSAIYNFVWVDAIMEAQADDLSEEELDEFWSILHKATITEGIMSLIVLVASVVAVFGANVYNTLLVAPVVVAWLARTIVSIGFSVHAINELADLFGDIVTIRQPIFQYVFWTVITLLWCYPNIGFISEVRAGTMSRATYPRESACCCS